MIRPPRLLSCGAGFTIHDSRFTIRRVLDEPGARPVFDPGRGRDGVDGIVVCGDSRGGPHPRTLSRPVHRGRGARSGGSGGGEMTIVKICGLGDVETALETAKAGADMVGLVFAESKRRVTPQQCHDIVEALKDGRTQGREAEFDGPVPGEVSARTWFAAWADSLEQSAARWRPLIVGVFAGMTPDEVNDIADAAGVDLVQLAGGEDDAFVRNVVRPVIRTVHVHPGMSSFDVDDKSVPGLSAGLHLDKGS